MLCVALPRAMKAHLGVEVVRCEYGLLEPELAAGAPEHLALERVARHQAVDHDLRRRTRGAEMGRKVNVGGRR